MGMWEYNEDLKQVDTETAEVLFVHHRLREVLEYIRENDIREYADLVDAVLYGDADALFWDAVVEHVECICAYLESVRRRKVMEQYQQQEDCAEEVNGGG